jgi:hypothetical protein
MNGVDFFLSRLASFFHMMTSGRRARLVGIGSFTCRCCPCLLASTTGIGAGRAAGWLGGAVAAGDGGELCGRESLVPSTLFFQRLRPPPSLARKWRTSKPGARRGARRDKRVTWNNCFFYGPSLCLFVIVPCWIRDPV